MRLFLLSVAACVAALLAALQPAAAVYYGMEDCTSRIRCLIA
jgi:hypothetical protein